MTGLTGDRRFWGATSEERGEKKHVVCGHGLPTVPGVRNLERKNELLGSREIWRGRVTLKTKQLEITGSNKGAVGPNQHEERRVITRGYVVLESIVTDAPRTRWDRKRVTRVPGAWDTGGTGAAPSCTGNSVFGSRGRRGTLSDSRLETKHVCLNYHV